MRRELPVPGPRSDLRLRTFEPGIDEAAWLEVNNRAFADHPEQGRWKLETLLDREAESWFDPGGLLLHEGSGRLDGFCWTKVHAGLTPPIGEVYVIAVDPAARGAGLGRALLLAGLDLLAGQGLSGAMLYVDSGNRAATNLYTDAGFHIDHIDRAYVGEVTPERPTSEPIP
jgi:mycothiol synthase